MPEQVTFQTRDRVNIKGTLWENDGPTVLLLHQYTKDRHSWNSLAEKLSKKGYNVLTFDFRGFGESDLDKDRFTVTDFVTLISDVKAARRFLESKNCNLEKIFIIGASIGANTAINYAPIDPHVEGVVLISAAMEYEGIAIDESMKIYQGSLLVISTEDDELTREATEEILDLAEDVSLKDKKIYPGNKHGTEMFENTDAEDFIVNWIEKIT